MPVIMTHGPKEWIETIVRAVQTGRTDNLYPMNQNGTDRWDITTGTILVDGGDGTISFLMLTKDGGGQQLTVKSDMHPHEEAVEHLYSDLPNGIPFALYNPALDNAAGYRLSEEGHLQARWGVWIQQWMTLWLGVEATVSLTPFNNWLFAADGKQIIYYGQALLVKALSLGWPPTDFSTGFPALTWNNFDPVGWYFSIFGVAELSLQAGPTAVSIKAEYPKPINYPFAPVLGVTAEQIESINVLATAIWAKGLQSGTLWGGRRAIAHLIAPTTVPMPGEDGTILNAIERLGTACKILSLQRQVFLSKEGNSEPGLGTVRTTK